MTIPTTKINSHTDAIVRSFDMHIDTTKSIKSLLEICKTLRNFIDLQSKRIDLLQKQFDTNQKILARYQMTEGSDEQRNNS